MSEATIILIFGSLMIFGLLGAASVHLQPAATGVFVAAATVAVASAASLLV